MKANVALACRISMCFGILMGGLMYQAVGIQYGLVLTILAAAVSLWLYVVERHER